MKTKIYGYIGQLFEYATFVFIGMTLVFAFYMPEHKHIIIYFTLALISIVLTRTFKSLYEINDEEEYKKSLKELAQEIREFRKDNEGRR